MTVIARKQATNRDRYHQQDSTRRNVLASVVIAAFMLVMSALASPMLASGPPDSSLPAEPAPGHKHKHRHLPTPAPTPMALPPEIQAKVPVYKPGPIPFHDGEQLVYQASWVGIPAAQARLEFHKEQKNDQNRWLGEIWMPLSVRASQNAFLHRTERSDSGRTPTNPIWRCPRSTR